MPPLSDLSGSEIARALGRLGFAKVRQSGSHLLMRNGSRLCVVPMHKSIKRGTLAGILRQAKISTEAFTAALLQ
ncbi:MAG: type II toxin-antitoxin system HicA family toxin [Burkholderiales bacterium]